MCKGCNHTRFQAVGHNWIERVQPPTSASSDMVNSPGLPMLNGPVCSSA
jgi:hypothetical protein